MPEHPTNSSVISRDQWNETMAIRAARLEELGLPDISGKTPAEIQAMPLGDRLSRAPSLADDPTGIVSPGGAETIVDQGNELVGAETVNAQGQFVSDTARRAEAGRVGEQVQGDIDEATGLADAALSDVERDRARFNANLTTASDEITKIPGAVDDKFETLKDELDAITNASFDRVEGREATALAKVEEGRSSAMQAAVQGAQGQVQSAIAQIQANPNLTQGQKSSMIAKAKIAGSSSIAATIGSSVAQFSKISADVAVSFGNIIGNLEGVGVQAKAGLLGQQGSTYAQTQVAVGQMTNRLLEIDASASASFTNSQAQLLGMRNQVQMSGNQLLANLVPEMGTPWFDPTGAASAALEISTQIQSEEWRRNLQEDERDIMLQMLREDQGSWESRIFDSMFGGFLDDGIVGGAVGLVGGAIEEIFNPQPQI